MRVQKEHRTGTVSFIRASTVVNKAPFPSNFYSANVLRLRETNSEREREKACLSCTMRNFYDRDLVLALPFFSEDAS